MKIATKMPSHWLSAHVLSTLPIFITTNLAAIGIWLLNISEHSMPLILGIIAGGLVDLDNNLSGRFKKPYHYPDCLCDFVRRGNAFFGIWLAFCTACGAQHLYFGNARQHWAAL